jgi:N-acyl-D-aspartate/D-glutamate deacylase
MKIVRDGGAGVIGPHDEGPRYRDVLSSAVVMVSSDGGIGSRHSAGAGTYPRVLGRYVRELHWLTLTEAIKKMTSLPAQRFRLRDRGLVRAGFKADLVLFDPERIIDRSTFQIAVDF